MPDRNLCHGAQEVSLAPFAVASTCVHPLVAPSSMKGLGEPIEDADFEVTLRREGAFEREVQRIRCLPLYEHLRPEALRCFGAALKAREVDESTVVLRWRDQDGLQFTIHGQEDLLQAMKDSVDDRGVVHLDFLLQVKPASREQRT